MAYEQRDNSGALFKNDKGDNEKRPDYKGDAMINGAAFEIGAWLREGKNGKFLSLSFKPKEGRVVEPPAKTAPKTVADMDSDIPF
jgi:hypothetical protein